MTTAATSTLERESTSPVPLLGDDDPHFTHIIPPQGSMTGVEVVMAARINGTPVEALCGHVFIPSRDPERHPVCEPCLDVVRNAQDDPDVDGSKIPRS